MQVIQTMAYLRLATVDGELKDYMGPIITQYLNWLKGVVTEWDWGLSTKLHRNVPVTDVIRPRIPITIQVNLIAFLVYVPIGLLLGIVSAIYKNKIIDNVISVLTMLFMSLPSFVFMLILVLVFGFRLNWFPNQWPASDVDTYRFSYLVLPVVALSVAPIANLTRSLRGEITETFTSEFFLLARAKGLTRKQAVKNHAIRNSMTPIVPEIMMYFVSIITSSIVIEIIYSIPGLGRLFFRALSGESFDYNLIMLLSAIFIMLSLVSLLIVDILYSVVDPRIRIGSKK